MFKGCKKICYGVSSVLFLLSGCSSIATPPQEQDRQSAPDLEQKFGLGIIDQRFELDGFTGFVVFGSNSYDHVGNFSSTYKFACANKKVKRQYIIDVSSDYILNQDKTERFITNIGSVRYDEKNLRQKHVRKINKDLKDYEVVGPVALRCEGPTPEAYNPILLIINAAFVGEYGYYKYRNFEYVFTDKDFE